MKKAENAIIAGNNCLRSEEERYAPNQAISAGRCCCRSSGGGCRLWNLCRTGLSIETFRLSSTRRDATFTGFAGNEWRDVCGTDRLSAGTEPAAAFGFRRPESSVHEGCGPVSAAHHSRYVILLISTFAIVPKASPLTIRLARNGIAAIEME